MENALAYVVLELLENDRKTVCKNIKTFTKILIQHQNSGLIYSTCAFYHNFKQKRRGPDHKSKLNYALTSLTSQCALVKIKL
jgi:hypothetical protein